MTAEQKRACHDELEAQKYKAAEAVVEKFINGPLKKAIDASETFSACAETPGEFYSHGNLCYTICERTLNELGYGFNRTHDGGGMYEVIQVTWQTWDHAVETIRKREERKKGPKNFWSRRAAARRAVERRNFEEKA